MRLAKLHDRRKLLSRYHLHSLLHDLILDNGGGFYRNSPLLLLLLLLLYLISENGLVRLHLIGSNILSPDLILMLLPVLWISILDLFECLPRDAHVLCLCLVSIPVELILLGLSLFHRCLDQRLIAIRALYAVFIRMQLVEILTLLSLSF